MIEWSGRSLKQPCKKIGFSDTWIDWIICSLTSVKYKVLMNGKPRGNIILERVLHQGDPLSPFIFILCMEALVSILNHAGKITRCVLHARVPRYPTFSLLVIAFSSVMRNP